MAILKPDKEGPEQSDSEFEALADFAQLTCSLRQQMDGEEEK
jgi:hypothetical protein